MRLPKPSKSGREFLREVLIVILGVLVALGLEQVAASWHDRARAHDIRASMNEELADFAAVFHTRLVASRCIEAKLDALDRVLAGHGAGPYRNVGRPPFFFSSRGSWNSDAADLLVRYSGPETVRIYGEAYQAMAEFSTLAQQEQASWIALQTIERQDEPLGGDRRWHLVEAAGAARNANLLLGAIARQTSDHIRGLGIRPGPDPVSRDLPSRPLCLPLETAAGGR